MSTSPSASRPASPAMVWHIFRKDWKLLWPLGIASLAGQLLLAALRQHADPFAPDEGLQAICALVTLGLVIAMVLLIVLAVQQDAIPGVDQDWLVRPIRRRDLLLSKLLLVALLIHGPILAANLLRGFAAGFPFGPNLGAALLSNCACALVFSLPVMAIAALTRSLTEAILGTLAAFFSLLLVRLLVLALLYPFTHTFDFDHVTDDTGVAWIGQTLSQLVLLLITAGVLALQYFRRDTRRARLLFVGGFLVFMFTPDLPWRPAFAIQQWFSANSGTARSVTVAFDPARHADPAHADLQLLTEDAGEQKHKKDETKNKHKKKSADSDDVPTILLPLRFSGLPAGLVLHVDYTALRLVDAAGNTVYRGTGHVFDLPYPGNADGSALPNQTLEIPAEVMRQAGDQALRLELEYSLTLLRPHALPPLPALSREPHQSEAGYCASRIDDGGAALEVSCRAAGNVPPCISMVLEQAAGARRNPEKFDCALEYTPAPLQFSVDPFEHSDTELPLHDPSGAVHYPIDKTQLRDAQILISVYQPEAHFTRQLIIPQFRLRDWQATAHSTDGGSDAADAMPPAGTSQP